MTNETSRRKAIILFIVAALPILIYPAVFIANVMSLAGHGSEEASFILQVSSKAFMYSSLVYPLVYLASLILYWKNKRQLYINLPYYLLIFILFSLMIWYLNSWCNLQVYGLKPSYFISIPQAKASGNSRTFQFKRIANQ